MTEIEIQNATEASREQARRAYETRMGELLWKDIDDDAAERTIDVVRTNLEEDVAAAKRGKLSQMTDLGGENLKLALTLPSFYEYAEYTAETVRDSLSGNPKPKTVARRTASPIAEELFSIRLLFAEYVLALTALAKNIASPTYPEFREVALSLRRYTSATVANGVYGEDFVAETLETLSRLVFECAVDLEIAAYGKEERHG